MNGARTVTVPTLDHGPVKLPEPSWCSGLVELVVPAVRGFADRLAALRSGGAW